MKEQRFILINPAIAGNCIQRIDDLTLDGSLEVVIRNRRDPKTLAQLGAVFGVWIKHESERVGKSTKKIHRLWKRDFLESVYIIDPQSDEQWTWVELVALRQEQGDIRALMRARKRISLSWASVSQFREYMNRIEQHYMDIGYPMPILVKDYKNVPAWLH